MNQLRQIIIDKIAREGPITFKSFMDMALYYPELGYYSSPDSEIGREGDFYTSPHMHSAFGAMIGKQLIEMWEVLERPHIFHAVEMGAGLGYLCKDILDYLLMHSSDTQWMNRKISFLNALRYVIVEPFIHFREKQRNTLKNTLNHFSISLPPSKAGRISTRGDIPGAETQIVQWVSSLPDMQSNIAGCVVSNELLDAFPVHMIEIDDGLKEVFINVNGDDLVEEKHSPGSDRFMQYLNTFSITLQQGYRTEINLGIKKWLEQAASLLLKGFIMTIDYGYSAREYYSEDRTGGTLLCYHKHLYSDDPYQNIGQQDITAHVNFSSLKLWGEEYGLTTLGYCPQGIYLIASGIDELIVELYADSPDYLSEVSKIKGLIMPQGMGESHSVIIQYKGAGLPELKGFHMRNNVNTL